MSEIIQELLITIGIVAVFIITGWIIFLAMHTRYVINQIGELGWNCGYCKKDFQIKEVCDVHEEICKKKTR